MIGLNEESARKKYLGFSLGQEEFAVDILKIKEIIRFGLITPIPQTPAFIKGVINLRGNVVPVVDLSRQFQLPEQAATRTTAIIVAEMKQNTEMITVGLLVGAVNQVLLLAPQDVKNPPNFGTTVDVQFLEGLAKVGQKFVLILNLERILDFEGLSAAVSWKAKVLVRLKALLLV